MSKQYLTKYPDVSLRGGLRYGALSDAQILSKSEFTEVESNDFVDELYDDYARSTITDKNPDKNLFEEEEKWDTSSYGRQMINIREGGMRYDADELPWSSENLVGFIGDQSHESRAGGDLYAPDMRQYREQATQRLAYQSFKGEGGETTTAGELDRLGVLRVRKEADKRFKDTILWFTPSYEQFTRKGAAPPQDYTLMGKTVQWIETDGHNSVATNGKVRGTGTEVRSADYVRTVNDREFSVALLGQEGRAPSGPGKLHVGRNGTATQVFTEGMEGKTCFKHLALAIKQHEKNLTADDGTYGAGKESATIKGPGAGNRTEASRRGTMGAQLAESIDKLVKGKTAQLSNPYLNMAALIREDAEKVRAPEAAGSEHMRGGGQLGQSRIQRHGNTSGESIKAALADLLTTGRKTGGREGLRVYKRGTAIGDANSSYNRGGLETVNYKKVLTGLRAERIAANGERFAGTSWNTQQRKESHVGNTMEIAGATRQGVEFGSNAGKTRYGGRIGSKQTFKYNVRDTATGEAMEAA